MTPQSQIANGYERKTNLGKWVSEQTRKKKKKEQNRKEPRESNQLRNGVRNGKGSKNTGIRI